MSGQIGTTFKRLSGLFGKGPKGVVGQLENPPLPKAPVAVVGDIHGRADLLDKLLEKLAQDAPDYHLVFVGDYVDRGPDSRGVLDKLIRFLPDAICLLGNHEVMLGEFLIEPVEKGGRWLRNGGVATLASYDIILGDNPTTGQLERAVADFSKALADGTLDWLKARPLVWQSGNLVVSHAGMDPKQPVKNQKDRDLIWGHSRFLRDDRPDDLWVAHGHWARDRATCAAGRINVDTSAWKSGRLTAALIDPEGTVRFTSSR